MTYKIRSGCGFFAILSEVFQYIFRNIYILNEKTSIIDFDDKLFPYNDNNDEIYIKNIFYEYFNLLENIDPKINIDNVELDKYITGMQKHCIVLSDYIYDMFDSNNSNFYEKLYMQNQIIKLDNSNSELNLLKKNHYIFLNKIFYDNLKINENITQKVMDYYEKNMKDYYCIGIHYRGSIHKGCEMFNKISVFDLINEVEVFIKKNNINNFKIFIATDVKDIQDIFISYWKDNILYNKNNIYMSNNVYDREPHFGFALENKDDKNILNDFYKNKPGLDGGKQLLIDTLLLSKCNAFKSSESNLSCWVYIFNPYIIDV